MDLFQFPSAMMYNLKLHIYNQKMGKYDDLIHTVPKGNEMTFWN